MLILFTLPSRLRGRDDAEQLLAEYGCYLAPAAFGPPVIVARSSHVDAVALDDLRYLLGTLSHSDWARGRGWELSVRTVRTPAGSVVEPLP